jgi:peptidoglycan/LPS O-acetylase OafA/YrhL
LKPHYPVLDGLRGTAAILVVIFHLFEGVYPDLTKHPMHHGYLAVDFFFLLSGFVVGYAYDDRWGKMTIAEFFKIRLIRLHPLVVISILIGAITFWFDPISGESEKFNSLELIGITLLGVTLLPTPDVRGWGETHSLNGPCWSLLQEYIANILYAFFGRRMNRATLWVIVIISAIVLTAVAVWRRDVATGWGYSTFWIGLVRMMFPFFAGLLLFRIGKLLHVRHAYVACSLMLTLLFFLPNFGEYNGWYEAACIIIAFPLVVAAGAGSKINGRWAKICNFSGAISYPIYILHYPFIYIYTMWIYVEKPEPVNIIIIACLLFIIFMILAYVILKWFDEPVRAWLKNRMMSLK